MFVVLLLLWTCCVFSEDKFFVVATDTMHRHVEVVFAMTALQVCRNDSHVLCCALRLGCAATQKTGQLVGMLSSQVRRHRLRLQYCTAASNDIERTCAPNSDVTGAFAQFNLQGPQSREFLDRITSEGDTLPYSCLYCVVLLTCALPDRHE